MIRKAVNTDGGRSGRRFSLAAGDPAAARRRPRRAVVADAIRARTVAGAFHVHSTRSDGTGDREAIAAAAARAGLQFVVITDHGDATRTPDPPAYLDGVLCIDAVEISTQRRPPHRARHAGRAVSARRRSRGRRRGCGAARRHAASPRTRIRRKPELAWKDWAAPVGGLEWLNLDSEWRDEPCATTGAVAVRLVLFGQVPALASLLDRPVVAPDALGSRWPATRTVVGLAGHDAHGGLVAERSEEGSALERCPASGVVRGELRDVCHARRAR